MPELEASLPDDSRVIIYDCSMFITHATAYAHKLFRCLTNGWWRVWPSNWRRLH